LRTAIATLTTLLVAAGIAGADPTVTINTSPGSLVATWQDGQGAAISDFSTTVVRMYVPDGLLITDLNVDLLIQHTWQGDLTVELEKDGTRITLIDRPGVPQSTFGFSTDNFGNPSNGTEMLLDDEASLYYDLPDTSGFNNPTGAWKPSPGLLSAFDGFSTAGLWTLYVTDSAGGDQGSILQWSLHATTAAVPEPTLLALMGVGFAGVLVRRRRRRAA
jgi:subtilisin-like proprotein convertase family protein